MRSSDMPPEILNLPVSERLELVAEIWDSIANEGLPPLTRAQRALIDERISEADSSPESRMLADEVFNELRQMG